MKRSLLILICALGLFGCTLTTTGGISVDWTIDAEISPPPPGPWKSRTNATAGFELEEV